MPASDETTPKEFTPETLPVEPAGIFGRKKKLLCRFMVGNICIGTRKVKYGSDRITYQQKTFSLNYLTTYINQKGIPEINLDFYNGANSLQLKNTKEPKDDMISKADSEIIRNLYKRGTIKAIWGVDTMPMVLLIIIAIFAMVALVFAFYQTGQLNQANATIKSLQAQLQSLATVTTQ